MMMITEHHEEDLQHNKKEKATDMNGQARAHAARDKAISQATQHGNDANSFSHGG